MYKILQVNSSVISDCTLNTCTKYYKLIVQLYQTALNMCTKVYTVLIFATIMYLVYDRSIILYIN
jgi:hypothetical protein